MCFATGGTDVFFSGAWDGDVREFDLWHSCKPIHQWWLSKTRHWVFMGSGTWTDEGFSNPDIWGIAGAALRAQW